MNQHLTLVAIRIRAIQEHKEKQLERAIDQVKDEVAPILRGILEGEIQNQKIIKSIMENTHMDLHKKGRELTIRTQGLAELFDAGWDYFDMKIGMLRTRRRKKAKDGSYYIDVPIQFTLNGPIAQMQQEKQWMSDEGRVQVLGLGHEADAKGTVWGKKSLVTLGHKGRRGAYKNLLSAQSTYSHVNIGSHVKEQFRRISANSQAHTWINKGRYPMNFSKRLLKKVYIRLQRILRSK